MPDEYQPPNKILFIQNLPENAGKDALEVLFKQFQFFLLFFPLLLLPLSPKTHAHTQLQQLIMLMFLFFWYTFVCRYPNLVEVRTIPGRSNIAFVEYVDATSSGVAKDALHNYKFDGEHKIKVTFAKQ
jgi:hypothetical protein